MHLSQKSSLLFSEMHKLTLTENTRVRAIKNDARDDSHAIRYTDCLLKVGEENVPTAENSYV